MQDFEFDPLLDPKRPADGKIEKSLLSLLSQRGRDLLAKRERALFLLEPLLQLTIRGLRRNSPEMLLLLLRRERRSVFGSEGGISVFLCMVLRLESRILQRDSISEASESQSSSSSVLFIEYDSLESHDDVRAGVLNRNLVPFALPGFL